MESRRKALEELQEVGRREVDVGREELRLAAEGLEKEKGDIKAAWKVCSSYTQKACGLEGMQIPHNARWGQQ